MKKLIRLALFAGAVAFAAKFMAGKKAEWSGLTEAELRGKLDQRFGSRMPDEKRAEVADKVVGKMRERGMLREEAPTASRPSGDGDGSGTV